jgi:hypothetical protein
MQLIAVCSDGSNSTCTESIGAYGRHRAANVGIVDSRQVRISQTVVQRCDPAVAIDVSYVDVGDVHRSKAATEPTPPGKERIARTDGQPAEAPPSAVAESQSDSKTTSESKERHVGRCPQGTVAEAYRSGPPYPRTVVIHPAAIVIRRPAPRLRTYPRPAVVRFPNPVAITIRRPVFGLIRFPY